MRDTRGVIRLENFHDLPVRLLHGPSGPRAGVSSQPPTLHPEGIQEQDRHITVCPSKGRSAVRQAGTIMSVYRDLGVSADRWILTDRRGELSVLCDVGHGMRQIIAEPDCGLGPRAGSMLPFCL